VLVRLLFADATAVPPTSAAGIITNVAPSGEPKLASQYRLVYSSDALIFENTRAVPRAFLAEDVETVADANAAISAMREPGIDPRATAFVESPQTPRALNLEHSGGQADIISYKSSTIVINVEASNRSLLVLTDSYYPGWKALVDGTERTIYPTDLAFRGVIVEPGHHQVVFEYRPLSFYYGVGAASFGWAVYLAIFGNVAKKIGLVLGRKNRGAAD
jgi:hypothetical protein